MDKKILELIYTVMGTNSLEASGLCMFDYYPIAAEDAIRNQWFIKKGEEKSVRINKDEEVPIIKNKFAKVYGYLYFGAWTTLEQNAVFKYKLNTEKFITWLVDALELDSDVGPEELSKDTLWFLGTYRAWGKDFNTYFVRHSAVNYFNDGIASYLNNEALRGPAVIISFRRPKWLVGLLPDSVKWVVIDDLFERGRTDCQINHDYMKNVVKDVSMKKEVVAVRFEPSNDYRILNWNGVVYSLNERQAAVLKAMDEMGEPAQQKRIKEIANVNDDIPRIMKISVANNKTENHPLWNTLIKRVRRGVYCLDKSHKL